MDNNFKRFSIDSKGLPFFDDDGPWIAFSDLETAIAESKWRDPETYNKDDDVMVQVLCEVVNIDDESWDHVSIGDHAVGDKFVSIGFVSDDVDLVNGEWEPGWIIAGWNMIQDCYQDARGFRVLGWQPMATE